MIKIYNNRKFEFILVFNIYPKIKDNKLNIIYRSNTRNRSEIWF